MSYTTLIVPPSAYRLAAAFVLAAAGALLSGCAITPEDGCAKKTATEERAKKLPGPVTDVAMIVGGAVLYGHYVNQCDRYQQPAPTSSK